MNPRNLAEFAAGVSVIGGVMWAIYSFTGHVVASGTVPQWVPLGLGGLLLAGVLSRIAVRGVAGHAHGGERATVARHEAGHVVAARAVGGRVLSARLLPAGWLSGTGGLVTWDMSAAKSDTQRREANVTFLLAGQYAAGTSHGCGSDQAAVRQQLSGLSSSEAARVRSRAQTQARRIVASRRGEINRVAAQLVERGQL